MISFILKLKKTSKGSQVSEMKKVEINKRLPNELLAAEHEQLCLQRVE